MRKALLILLVLVVLAWCIATVAIFIRERISLSQDKSSVTLDSPLFSQPDLRGADQFFGFYASIINKMGLITWTKTEQNKETKEAGWIEGYEINNEDIYVSISKGLAEKKKQKMAFSASFKEWQVFCFCYFEDGTLRASRDTLSNAVFKWLFKRGFFDSLPGGSPKQKIGIS